LHIIEGLLRQELTLVQASRSIQVGLGQLEIGLALPDRGLRHLIRRLRLPDLFPNLAVFDARDDLPATNRIGQLDGHRLQPPVHTRNDLHRGFANEVANQHDLVGDRLALDLSELDGHGRSYSTARPAASAGLIRLTTGARLGGGRIAAAVVDHDTRQREEGDDDDDDPFTHYPPTRTEGYRGLTWTRSKSTSARR
jgi:hypothetical protein